jgi:hypothetical protein
MSGQSSSQNSSNMGQGSQSGNYNSQGTFEQNVFNSDALKQLYSQASKLFGQQQGQMPALQKQASNYINQVNQSSLPAWQKQLGGGAYSNVDAGQIYKQLTDSMNKPSNAQAINSMIMGGSGNNYADAMKAQYMKDASRAQGQMMANLDARAAGAGQSGGSRHGVAQGLGIQGINDSLQRNLAETGFNTFDKDLERKLGIAQQADQATLARQGMLQGMLGEKQNAMTGGIGSSGAQANLGMGTFAPGAMNWNNLAQYQNAIGGPAILNKGQNTGQGSMSGSNWNMGSASGKSGGGGV